MNNRRDIIGNIMIHEIQHFGAKVIFSRESEDNLSTIYYTFWGVRSLNIDFDMREVIDITESEYQNDLKKYTFFCRKKKHYLIGSKFEISEIRKEEIKKSKFYPKFHEERMIKTLIMELEKTGVNSWLVRTAKENFPPNFFDS